MKILYPGGKTKALTFSYDDGTVHDRRLVEMLERHSLKGTFHLNSGRFGHAGYIDAAEVKGMYAGQEVSCHGVDHKFWDRISKSELVNVIWEDRRGLERLTGQIVTGLSYPFGLYTDHVMNTALVLGIEYARNIDDSGAFFAPADFMRWRPTCHHNTLFEDDGLVDKFLNPPYAMVPELFYIWGHGYEFEQDSTWDNMEALCSRLAGQDDVWYATNIEYCRYLKAVRALVYDVEMKSVHNPSTANIWVEKDGKVTML